MTAYEVEIIPLELGYKGDRNYLHGTDMYDAIVAHFGPAIPVVLQSTVRMVIHGFSHNQLDLVYRVGAEKYPRPSAAHVEFSLAKNISGWLVETERPVLTRRPYSENNIARGSRITARSIIATSSAYDHSAIEVLVALTKHLHITLWGEESRWAFTKLELERPLNEADKQGLQVKLEHTLGSKLTKSRIYSSTTPLGCIYFSVVKA